MTTSCRFELFVTDIDELAVARAVRDLAATAVAPDAIYDQDVEVFAPCALGSILNDDTIPRLRASIVAGSANNQLAGDGHGHALQARNILYAPDYAINAGGVIWISHEGPHFDRKAASAHVARIEQTLGEIFARAAKDRITPSEAADRVAESRFEKQSKAA